MYITIQLQPLHSQSCREGLLQSQSCSLSTCEETKRVSDMKPVPAPLLLATVLLTTHIPLSACRPRDLSVLDGRGYKKQLDEVLLRPGDSAVSYLVGEKLLQYLQRKPLVFRSVSMPPQGLSSEAPEKGRWREVEGDAQELVGFSKRNEEPPISIDLTFHLLRNMIEMARIENQREQAELNRKYLDEVGK